jgi:hypothetical protein
MQIITTRSGKRRILFKQKIMKQTTVRKLKHVELENTWYVTYISKNLMKFLNLTDKIYFSKIGDRIYISNDKTQDAYTIKNGKYFTVPKKYFSNFNENNKLLITIDMNRWINKQVAEIKLI